MKKMLSLLIVLALLLPLMAVAEEPVTLTVWESDGVELDFIKAAAAKYQETHPNISFEFNSVGHTDAVQKLELDGPAMVGPDVFAAPHDKLGQMVVGELALPNPYTDELTENFMPSAIAAVTYNGVAYGYPTAVETYALFYNKDLIAEPPATWEELVAYCNEFNDPSADKYGIVWEVAAPYFNYFMLSAYGADLFGPEGNDKTAHNINTPEAIKGMEFFAAQRESILPVVADDLTNDFIVALFRDNRTVAMIVTGPWNISAFEDAGMNFGVAPLPILPDTETPPHSFSGVRAMFVSAFSEHPEEAQEFAAYIMSKEGLELRYEMTKTIPPRLDIVIDDNPYFQGIMEQAVYAKPMPSIPAMDGYWVSMSPAFKNIWNGEDIKTELDAAAAAVEAIQ